MRLVSLLGLSLAVIGGGACAAAVQEPVAASPQPAATAELRLSNGSPAGRVTFQRGPRGLLLRVEAEGLPPGWHGAHLHAVGTCEGPGFQSAGGHVNHPESPAPHGLLNWNGGPDGGDLQNLYAHADGLARAELYLAGATPLGGPNGLSFVIHENPDDHVSQPIGGAGGRIACAVLEPAGD